MGAKLYYTSMPCKQLSHLVSEPFLRGSCPGCSTMLECITAPQALLHLQRKFWWLCVFIPSLLEAGKKVQKAHEAVVTNATLKVVSWTWKWYHDLPWHHCPPSPALGETITALWFNTICNTCCFLSTVSAVRWNLLLFQEWSRSGVEDALL